MKKKVMYVFIMLSLSVLFLCSLNDYTVSAQRHELKSIGNNCNNSDDDVFTILHMEGTPVKIVEKDASNKLFVVVYAGPEKDNACRCENIVYIQDYLKVIYNGAYSHKLFYQSEHFDWNESRRFYFYVPVDLPEKVKNEGDYYAYRFERIEHNITIQREHSDLHNKGAYNSANDYTPEGIHSDKCYFAGYYYDVEKIGVEDNWLSVGDKVQANFVCEEFYESFTWSTDNDTVLSVDASGVVQAKTGGEANIFLSIDGQRVYTQKIYVDNLVMQNDMSLYENDSQPISVSGARNEIVWKSENEEIAVVGNGNVIAKKVGSTKIVGKINDLELSFNVTVKPRVLSANEMYLFSGENKEITLSGTTIQTEWSSNNDSIVKISNGIVTALKPGNAVITAKAGNQILECKVTVLKSSLSVTDIEAYIGENVRISIIGSQTKPEFASSNEEVIRVKKGELFAVGSGKTTISVKIGNETLKCKVKVHKMPAPTGFEYEASSKIIKLRWDEYDGAKNYNVYMYTSEKSVYELISTVKKPLYSAKDLEAGKTYIFKVAANLKIDDDLVEQALSDKIKCKTEKKDKAGWQTIDGKKYYFKEGFAVEAGLQKIDGNKYIFNADGSVITQAFTSIDGAKYYSDSNGKVAVNTEVTDEENNVTYVADKDGVLTKKKKAKTKTSTNTSTKTVTFKDITLEVPSTWTCSSDKSNYICYEINGAAFELYTVSESGSMTQKKADSIVKDIGNDYDYLNIKNSKMYSYKDKKITAFYLYSLNLGVKNYNYVYTGRMTVDSSGRMTMYEAKPYTLDCKSRLTTFEYNGNYYVATMTFEKSKCKSDSFDEYTEVIKSIKPTSKSSGGSTKKNGGSGTNKNSGQKTDSTVYVWVTETGKKYHRINNCGNGTYWKEDIDTAKKRGLTPCGKCY